MEAIPIKNGIIHMAESKANCPYCTRHVEFDEVEVKLNRTSDGFIAHRCKGCNRKIGIASDIRGDIVSFEL